MTVRQVIHANGIWVGLCLSTEDGGIQDDVGDVVQDVLLDLDETSFSEDDDLYRFNRLSRGIFEVLDLGDDPDHINVRHRLAHQTRHDTKTPDLDLGLPIDDLVFEGGDQNLSSLALLLRPTDDLLLLVTRETGFFYERPVVVVVLGEGLISLRNNTELIVLDTVVRSHENVGGNKGGDERNEEEKTAEDGAEGEVTSRLERPTHCRVVHDQGPSKVRFRRGGHVDKVNGQGVRGKSVENHQWGKLEKKERPWIDSFATRSSGYLQHFEDP